MGKYRLWVGGRLDLSQYEVKVMNCVDREDGSADVHFFNPNYCGDNGGSLFVRLLDLYCVC